jgi:hypothetical protein
MDENERCRRTSPILEATSSVDRMDPKSHCVQQLDVVASFVVMCRGVK